MTHNPSRRRFLAQLAGASAIGVSTPLWLELVQRGGLPFAWGMGEGDTLPTGTPICVHIALNGGNDDLNTLVPINDGWYRSSTVGHGPLALTQAETLALNGTTTYRLHNKLAWLANRWNTTGDVAFALGVGNMAENFSHFDSRKFWSTARLDVGGKTGWFGRYADAVRPQNALASVSIGEVQPEAMSATAPMFVLNECSKFAVQTASVSPNVMLNSWKQMGTIPGSNLTADVSRMLSTTFDVSARVSGADDPAVTGSSSGYSTLSPIAQDMIQTALLIKTGIPAQSYALGIGGYDSHINQKQEQSDNFTALNDALSRFFSILSGHPRANDVFVLITTEFGRQVTYNHENGTDHGQAGMAIFIGKGVYKGIFGQAPTLDPGGPTKPNRIADAMKPTLDFRSVHATVLNRLAKGDANVGEAVLGAHYEDLGVFAGPPPTTTTTTAPTTTTTTKPTTTTIPANKAPVASFTLNKTSGLMPLTVSASASASKDPDGSIVSYKWAWGDGTLNSSGVSASHKFTKRGTFTVRLTVTDNKGAVGTVTKTVTVL
jgi:uncharacterized protein (DUF1501 family)